MSAECNRESFEFHPVGRRKVVARFDGGRISSDAGGLLLRETERLTGVIHQFAACFTDHRNPELIEHTAEELVAQRIYALALGYEDLNDHDDLRHGGNRTKASRRLWARRIRWGKAVVERGTEARRSRARAR